MRFLFSALLTLSLCAFTVAPAPVKIEYVFKKGDQFIVKQNTKQTMKQTIMGGEQKFDNTFTAEYSFTVAEQTSTGGKIEVKYIKLKNDLQSTMIQSVMDSEGPAETTENKVFKSVVNKPFFVYLNKRGKVEKLENAENLWSGLGDTGLDETAQQSLKQNLSQILGEATLSATIEQMLITYAEKAVNKGDTWNVSNSFPMGFPIETKDTWSVEQLSSAQAFLTGDGTATSDKEKVIEVQGGLKAKADLSGRQAKKSTVDLKTGWPTKMEMLSEMKGNMTLLKGGMIQEDMQIPMEVVTESSFAISKK